MKYIRTKDGKVFGYEIKNETDLDNGFVLANALVAKSLKEGFEIAKVTDTIEELCDEFVAIAENGSPYLFSIYEIDNKKYVYINEESGEPLLETFIKNKIVYGAIWTDKGLIYVAKMNDKGELELL